MSRKEIEGLKPICKEKGELVDLGLRIVKAFMLNQGIRGREAIDIGIHTSINPLCGPSLSPSMDIGDIRLRIREGMAVQGLNQRGHEVHQGIILPSCLWLHPGD